MTTGVGPKADGLGHPIGCHPLGALVPVGPALGRSAQARAAGVPRVLDTPVRGGVRSLVLSFSRARALSLSFSLHLFLALCLSRSLARSFSLILSPSQESRSLISTAERKDSDHRRRHHC